MAFQGFSGSLSLHCGHVRYIGRFAFQDCRNLNTLDFSDMDIGEGFIPVLASPEAFMLQDRKTFVNDSFRILVPDSLYDKWTQAINWVALKNHITGV